MIKAGQHLIFWIISYLFFILFYGRANRDYPTTVIFASLLFPLAIITGYFLNYWLIPYYFYTSRYWHFVLFLSYTIVFTMWGEVMISLFVFVTVSNFHVSKLDPASFDVVFLLVGLYFVIIGFIAIEQLKSAFRIMKENTRLEKIRMETELKLHESELKLLRAQLNPHFLFNTLNNLYGLTLEKSDIAPGLVLKLSDLMDYMLYRCNRPKVNLKNEVDYLSNYVDIEHIRYGDKLQIQFEKKGPFHELEIAPMILLPFFENTFKHGASKSGKHPFVFIQIQVEGRKLLVNIKNSHQHKGPGNNDSPQNGIGLKNASRRLQLVYPDKYSLKIKSTATCFEVNLEIVLDKATTIQNENIWTN